MKTLLHGLKILSPMLHRHLNKSGATSSSMLLLSISIAMGLSGCGGSNKVMKPEAAFPASYRGASAVADTSATAVVAQLPYNQFFTDKTLLELLDGAVAKNLDLQVAISNIEYARQTLNAAQLGILPVVNLGAQDVKNYSSDNGPQKTPHEHIASASATWELDIWGKLRSRNRSALASYLKSQEAAKAVRTRLIADVASGYYNLLMLDQQLAISKKNLALAETTLRMTKLQYEAGLVTNLAVQQQEAARQAIALSLPVIEQNIAIQENALSILCGTAPNTIQRNSSLFAQPIVDALPTGIPTAMLQNRPDVRASELGVRAASADVGEAQANLYPSFVITAQGGFNAFKASNWFKMPESLFGSLQSAVVQPLFQRGQLKAKYEQSKIVRQQSELQFKQTVLKAVGEVSDALVRLEKLKQQEKLAHSRVATLEKALSNSYRLFQSGMATYLEVMVAQSNMLSAELSLADIHRQHLVAKTELYRALGGGWREEK